MGLMAAICVPVHKHEMPMMRAKTRTNVTFA
jgi:hypothetical protein